LGFGRRLGLEAGGRRLTPGTLVLYYSEVPRDRRQAVRLACPILGFFSSRDAWVTPDKVRAFKAAIKGARATLQTFSFDVLPGFGLDPKTPTERGYAETARAQMDEFLARNLQLKTGPRDSQSSPPLRVVGVIADDQGGDRAGTQRTR